MFLKVTLIVALKQFWLKVMRFRIAPKVLKHLGYIWKKICQEELSKIALSCHTGLLTILYLRINIVTLLGQFCFNWLTLKLYHKDVFILFVILLSFVNLTQFLCSIFNGPPRLSICHQRVMHKRKKSRLFWTQPHILF